MSKKKYYIVDPETGETVGEEYVGGLRKYIYQAMTAGLSRKQRWLVWILLISCVLLFLAEPLLESAVPSFYRQAHEIIFVGLILLLSRGFFVLYSCLNRKKKKKKKIDDEEKAFHVVDAESREIVGRRCPENGTQRFDTSTLRGRLARMTFYIALICFFLSLLSAISILLVPDSWKVFVAMAFMLFFVVMYVSAMIFNHVG